MITLDGLARYIGCTLSDLDDLDILVRPAKPDTLVMDRLAGELLTAWENAK